MLLWGGFWTSRLVDATTTKGHWLLKSSMLNIQHIEGSRDLNKNLFTISIMKIHILVLAKTKYYNGVYSIQVSCILKKIIAYLYMYYYNVITLHTNNCPIQNNFLAMEGQTRARIQSNIFRFLELDYQNLFVHLQGEL